MITNIDSVINRKDHHPHHELYLIIGGVACYAMGTLLCINAQDDQLKSFFDLLNSIVSGSFASIVVAWLIEAQNCSELNRKNDIYRVMVFSDLYHSIEMLFLEFPHLAEKERKFGKDYTGEDHEWYYWIQRIVDEAEIEFTKDRKILLKDCIDKLEEANNILLKNEYKLVSDKIVNRCETTNLFELKTDLVALRSALCLDKIDRYLLPPLIEEMKQHIARAKIISFYNDCELCKKVTLNAIRGSETS